MSFITDIYNNAINKFADAVASRVLTESGKAIHQARLYRTGRQPKQLKVKQNQYDDNLILNFIGLIVNRSVSQMVGGGVSFKFETGETVPGMEAPPTSAQQQYVEAMWEANKHEILLHRAVLSSSEAGTGYILLCDPSLNMGGMVGEDGIVYPRLMLWDPQYVTMQTLPEDFEQVIGYTLQYKFVDVTGYEAMRRREVKQEVADDSDTPALQWVIVDSESSRNTGNRWQEVAHLEWPYPFAPVVHWQNLPTIDSPCGEPDVTTELINTQDSFNAGSSNLNKSLRLGADPMRWSRNYDPARDRDGNPIIDIGPGRMVNVGTDGEVGQLPPMTDWNGSLAFLKFIRAVMFDVSRTVDIDSLEDKLGSLTNFALRVIYQDNASKIATKRDLFGDALEEINRRVQTMGGFEPIPTETVWPEFLPISQPETVAMVQAIKALEVISDETVFEVLKRFQIVGGAWKTEQARIASDRQATDNLGAFLLRGFDRGGGGVNLPPGIGEA